MSTIASESYASKLADTKASGNLPLDGSMLTTRIPVDYTGLDGLVTALTAALMLEKPHVATSIIEVDRDFWEGATSSSFNLPEERLKLLDLLEALFDHLDMENYRLEIVRTVPRHR